MLRLLLSLLIVLPVLAACDWFSAAEQTDEISASDAALVDVDWRWVNTITPVERIDSVDSSRYRLLLRSDGHAEALFDCNRGGGIYVVTGHQISFGAMMSTRMACPEDSQDHIFAKQLEQVTTYFIDDGDLYLEMPMDSGTMRFERAQSE